MDRSRTAVRVLLGALAFGLLAGVPAVASASAERTPRPPKPPACTAVHSCEGGFGWDDIHAPPPSR